MMLLGEDWRSPLSDLLKGARERLLLVTPFVSAEGTDLVAASVSPEIRANGRLDFLTDLSPVNVCSGATDPKSLESVQACARATFLWHLPRLHAKVYIADGRRAILTSANLTAGGLRRNYERGVLFDATSDASSLECDVRRLCDIAARVSPADLANYRTLAERLRQAFLAKERAAQAHVRAEFQRAFSQANDDLIRLRLAGGAMHTVFARTILYILQREGPMTTPALHDRIQALHPDLCDDSVDRVISGKHFGKKWKHAVRTAQQQLKQAHRIAGPRAGLWHLIDGTRAEGSE